MMKKLKFFSSFAAVLTALLTPLAASAVPAYPGVMKMTNPDGSTIDVRLHGDEFFSYYTDADNDRILTQDADGFWRQMNLDGKLLTVNNGGVMDMRAVMPEPIHQPNGAVMTQNNVPGLKRLSVNSKDGRTGFPSINPNMKGLVVLLEYADKSFSIPNPKESFEKLCNEQGYSEYGHSGSVKDYFSHNSMGQFVPTFDVVGPVKVSRNYAYYTGNTTGAKYSNWGYALKEALEKLDGEVEFDKYDLDDDGYIDFIYFIYAGYGQADSPDKDAIWPHRGDYKNYSYTLGLKNLILDGKTFNSYACSNELIYNVPQGLTAPCVGGIGTICHEFSHVIGLPDLYDTNGGYTSNPEEMDVMAGGNYNNNSRTPVQYSAYERYFCRWMELETAKEGESYVLNTQDRAGASAVKIPVFYGDTDKEINEYFVIEGRRKAGWDKYLPHEGICVWRVKFDYSAWSNNNVNVNNNPKMMLVKSSASSLAWPGKSNVLYVTPESEYPIKPDAPVTSTEVWLTGLSFDAGKGEVVFEYNKVKSFPDCVTVLREAKATGPKDNVYELTWDEYPGATGYIVNQWSVNKETGEEFALAPVTVSTDWFKSAKVPLRTWNDATYRASITVIDHLPSTRSSNVLEFKLADLSWEGIGEVEVDENAPIFGGTGCVYAPEGAEVYTLSGVRVGVTDLPAGLYVVRTPKKAVKVVVK